MPTTDAAVSMIGPRPGVAASARGAIRRWMAVRGRALLPLILLVPIPASSVLIAMSVPGIKGELPGRLLYLAAKAWIILLPAAWLLLVERGRISFSPPRRGGLGAGALTGLGIFCIIALAYWLLGRLWIDSETVRAQVQGNGIGNPLLFLPFVCVLALLNSLVEEYVWRWFVFSRCERLVSPVSAVVLTAGLFTLHHIVSLRAHLGWDVTALGSIGCFLGGLIWSWLYLRCRSIWPGYVSHVLADAAIYLVAWHILFGSG
jgi:membrane protease YdiL (CAAX protease family)